MRYAFGLVALGGIMIGCSRLSSDKWEPTLENLPDGKFTYVGVDTRVTALQDDDVIVAVNGATLTKAGFYLHMKQLWWILSRDPYLRDRDRQEIYMQSGREQIGKFVQNQILIQASRQEKLLNAADIRTNVAAVAEAEFKRLRIDKEKFDREFPGGLAAFYTEIENLQWTSRYIDAHAVKGVEITGEAVSNILADVATENRGIGQTNAMYKAELFAVRGEILSGKQTFEEAAEKMSKKYGGDNNRSGNYARKDLEEADEIWELDVGDISPVFSDADTYYIVKMTNRTAAKRDKDGKLIEPESVELLRIERPREQEVVLAEGFDGIKIDLQRQMDSKALQEKIAILRQSYNIVYPHGTNFWAQTIQQGDSVTTGK